MAAGGVKRGAATRSLSPFDLYIPSSPRVAIYRMLRARLTAPSPFDGVSTIRKIIILSPPPPRLFINAHMREGGGVINRTRERRQRAVPFAARDSSLTLTFDRLASKDLILGSRGSSSFVVRENDERCSRSGARTESRILGHRTTRPGQFILQVFP